MSNSVATCMIRVILPHTLQPWHGAPSPPSRSAHHPTLHLTYKGYKSPHSPLEDDMQISYLHSALFFFSLYFFLTQISDIMASIQIIYYICFFCLWKQLEIYMYNTNHNTILFIFWCNTHTYLRDPFCFIGLYT